MLGIPFLPRSPSPQMAAQQVQGQQQLAPLVAAQVQQRNLYQMPTQMRNAIDWLLENPSIPLAMRQSFIFLWEVVPFGNYGETDIAYLMSKFREWRENVIWITNEYDQGNPQEFPGDDGGPGRSINFNVLFNELEQLYFINLTRGKEGFTVREMNTARSFIQTGDNSTPGGHKAIKIF
jgi:hypothetical protein